MTIGAAAPFPLERHKADPIDGTFRGAPAPTKDLAYSGAEPVWPYVHLVLSLFNQTHCESLETYDNPHVRTGHVPLIPEQLDGAKVPGVSV